MNVSSFISELPFFLLSLPVVLIALSVHETAHGYVAYKLGDPTAYSLGRLTLNPLKHFDPIGLVFMVIFHIGWAKPVPINTRYFKNPKRGMAITAAAGPASNLLLALLFAALLRLAVLGAQLFYEEELLAILKMLILGQTDVTVGAGIKLLAVLAYILHMGVIVNVSLAIFNLIPIPPFDGSRIAHLYLPTKWYFAIMRYERILLIVVIASIFVSQHLFPSGDSWLSIASSTVSSGFLWIFGLNGNNEATAGLGVMITYVYQALAL